MVMTSWTVQQRKEAAERERIRAIREIVGPLTALDAPRADTASYVQPFELLEGMSRAAEPVQLVGPWNRRAFPRRAIAQLKDNGIRAFYLQSRVLSRNALPLDCAIHCLPTLKLIEQAYGEPCMVDGEYVEGDSLEATLAAHKRGHGSGWFSIFDIVPLSEWRVNRFTQPTANRMSHLAALSMFRAHRTPWVRFLGCAGVESPDMAERFARTAWADRREGVVIKDVDAPYQRGRSGLWMKIKNTVSEEATVIDADRGRGLSGTFTVPVMMIGAAEAGDIKSVTVRTESGRTLRIGTMPPEMRKQISADPDNWRGRILEIGYTDTNDAGKPQGAHILHPRFDKEPGLERESI